MLLMSLFFCLLVCFFCFYFYFLFFFFVMSYTVQLLHISSLYCCFLFIFSFCLSPLHSTYFFLLTAFSSSSLYTQLDQAVFGVCTVQLVMDLCHFRCRIKSIKSYTPPIRCRLATSQLYSFSIFADICIFPLLIFELYTSIEHRSFHSQLRGEN